MSGLWKNDPETPEGKYPIVLRRDGTVFPGPYFVIAYRDPCAAVAFAAYAGEAFRQGMDPEYVEDLKRMASQAESEAALHGSTADPDAPRHRIDDPVVIAWARQVHKLGVGSS